MGIKNLAGFEWVYPGKALPNGAIATTRTAANFTTGETLSVRAAQTKQHGGVSFEHRKKTPSPAISHQVPISTGQKKVAKGASIAKPQSRYSRDIVTFASKHNMTKGEVRRDSQFQLLNRDFSSKLKKRDALIDEIHMKKFMKEDTSKLVEKKNKLDDELGHLARELGRKSPDDFTPFGQTP